MRPHIATTNADGRESRALARRLCIYHFPEGDETLRQLPLHPKRIGNVVGFILETSDATDENDIRIHSDRPTVDGPAKITGLASGYIIFVLTLIGRGTSPMRRQRSFFLNKTT